MSGNWLDLSNSSNRYIRMYVKGFVDVSGGNVRLRGKNDNLLVDQGDTSFNSGNVFVGNVLTCSGGVVVKNNLNMVGLINQSNITLSGGYIYKEIVSTDINNSIIALNNTVNTLSTNLVANTSAGSVTLGSGANVFLGNVTNNTTVNSLKLVTLGDASINGSVAINGNLFINKDLNVTGNLSVNQYQTKQTITTLNYQLQVVEDLSINGRLFLQGAAAINGNATITGTTNLGGMTTTGNMIIVPALGVAAYNNISLDGDVGIIAIGTASGSAKGLVLSNWNNNTGGIRIAPNGNVGIGTTNPISTLHVAGNAAITGDVSFGGNLVLSTSNFTGTVSPNSTAATSNNWSNNGITWTSSASSLYTGEAGFTSEKLFDNNVNTSWHNTGSGYTSGVATTAFSTSIDSGGTVSTANGDWIQIQSSVPVIMKNFTLNLRSGLPGRMPKTFYLVGSNNGSTWTTIMYGTTTSTTGTLSGLVPVSTLTSSGTGTISNFYGTTSLSYTTYGNVTTPFTNFRIITTHLTSTGENLLNISEWTINFTPAPATSAITLAPSTTAYGQLVLTGGLTTTSNVGIGTNNPAYPLHVNGNLTATDGFFIGSNSIPAYNSWGAIMNSGTFIGWTGGYSVFVSNGQAVQGTFRFYGTGAFANATTSQHLATINAAGCTGTSDYRIKTDIVELDDTYNIDNLRPVKFRYINSENLVTMGFIAHEVAEVFPFLVDGEKDAVNEDGSISNQMFNINGLIAPLVYETQKLKKTVASQEAKIDALVARLAAAGIA